MISLWTHVTKLSPQVNASTFNTALPSLHCRLRLIIERLSIQPNNAALAATLRVSCADRKYMDVRKRDEMGGSCLFNCRLSYQICQRDRVECMSHRIADFGPEIAGLTRVKEATDPRHLALCRANHRRDRTFK